VAILWLEADSLASDGVIVTAQRDPPPIGDPVQRSDMLTSSEEKDATVTLAETPSQSKAAASPSNTTRPFHVTKLLLAGTVAAFEIQNIVQRRKHLRAKYGIAM
jgi:hypothetical protein